MEVSENAKQIITQAEQWTFAGDCALLQWMEEIGKNLEERATATNKNFDQLSTNLKQTSTALDNVTNSLDALQYTQFVENRCHDDDETIANVTEVPVDVANQNDQPKDSDDVWQRFLKNNLEALRNCHERYSLDLEDSDEEDATNNFIYQPKNPYNECLLPHIYGSKLWNENWHVGLCDDSNSFSGDDISEAFSETSSSPADDNDSFASNSANLAEWTSASSITNEKHQEQQPIRIQNASSLRGSQPLFPSAQESLPNAVSVAAGSENSSAASANVPMGLKQNEPRFDIFARVQDSPPPPPLSSSSSVSSLQQQKLKSADQSENNIRRDSADLVAKPKTVNPTIDSSYISPIKRRPVNLFDDDDFSSFLTEIVEKSTSREAVASNNNNTTPDYDNSVRTDEKEQEKIYSSMVPNTQPIKIGHQTNKKPPTLNLFDSPDSSPKNEDLFAQVKEAPVPNKEENIVRPKLSTKTLFDDDDDDDFLAIFATKKENISKPVSKLKLFDDDIEDETLQNMAVPPIDKITNIQVPNEDKDLFKKTETIKQKDSPIKKTNLFAEVTDKKYISKEQKEENLFTKKMQLPINLFDDVNEADDKNANKSPTPAFQKKTDIFSSEDDDDLFKTTFEQGDRRSSQNLEEKIRNIKPVNAALLQVYDQKPKEHIEPMEIVPKYDFSQKNTEVKQVASREDFPQKEKIIDQIVEEIVKENDEKIHSNKTELNADVPNALKQSTASIEKQVNTTYSDLFLEEPPDDESAFFKTLDVNVLAGSSLTTHDFDSDSYEPALPKVPTEDRAAIAKVIPTSSYGNLGLFSDVPPDDDLEDLNIESANISNNEPKRIHSIFYDDFNETMEALNNRKSLEINPSLHSIFYDEPPPDDDFQALLESTVEVSEQQPVINQVSGKPDEQIPALKNDAVSKLKLPSININVQALLPGASQKSQLRKSIENEQDLESNFSPVKTHTSFAISAQNELKRDSAENILFNVCKNRVRAPARRRPSTRRGRQENYRKSLVAEEEDKLNIEEQFKQEIQAIAKSTQKDDEELAKIAVQSNKEVTKDIAKTNQAMEGTISSALSLTTAVTDLFDEMSKEKQKNATKVPVATLTNKSSSTGLFFNEDDNENDDYNFLFENVNENKTIKESSKSKTVSFLPQVAKSDDVATQKNVQADNSQEENYIPSTKISDNIHEISEFDDVMKLNKELSEDIGSANKSFDAFESSATHKEPTVKTIFTKTISVPGGQLFDDDESDDFLFANKINSSSDIFVESSEIKTQSSKDYNESKPIENSQSDITNDNKSPNIQIAANFLVVSKEPEKKASSANLFGDDDDDDILFGSSTTKTQPQAVVKTARSAIVDDFLVEQTFADSQKNTTKAQQNKLVTTTKVSSLFGSDEDEDDQKDNGSIYNAMKNPANLKTRLSKVAEKEDSKALFSDTDDDEEDLFGSKATKATLPKSSLSNENTATKKPLLQSRKSTPSAATTTDNPLADLFSD